MKKYAKILNNDTGLCSVGLGTDTEYYISIGMSEMDVELSDVNNDWYLSDKCPHLTPEEMREREQEKINNLTMTPLDFIKVLQVFGLTLEQINGFLDSRLDIKTQLTYCNLVYCGVAKSFLPVEIEGITITPEMVEQAFIAKNEEG